MKIYTIVDLDPETGEYSCVEVSTKKVKPKFWQRVNEHTIEPGPLVPDVQTLVKLGSLIVHAQEFLSPDGHEFDLAAFKGLLADSDVVDWLREMRKLALIPEMRV